MELYSRGVSGRSPLYAAEGSGDTELKFIRPEIDTFKIFLKIVMDTDPSASRATPSWDNRIIWRIIRLFFVIEILIFAFKDLFKVKFVPLHNLILYKHLSALFKYRKA